MKLRTLMKSLTVILAPFALLGCSEYGDFTQLQICKASLAAIKGKSPSIMSVDKTEVDADTELDIFHISYKRPDDGKKWLYRCKVDKTRAVWSQGQDGRWRDQAQDPTIRFTIDGDEIEIHETFPDGSASFNVTYNISMLGGKS
ncbi:hypothetical protein [Enterovibrio nigricans]|uniref:Lipoprotein n=1 Tax=Enterovibrio nigricans DSM 22720 TaxID=1121868 RepID=A0A1T4UM97_9GAMM|nr:hypothetical protein [Enterovibrio nigricans]PKF49848.1 hypothetical protein AT251_15715 [Enterovibrio nigricans]SKA53815.1 hypothetical protein SAMN02745132_02035 [Enterovibrio nigricans DSM 22720]